MIKKDYIEIRKRRTFAIISHPDSGKSTITEKILLLCNIVRNPDAIKTKDSGKYVTSDWMQIEKDRGISVTSSVMQFYYNQYVINLLDTPGHEDFSEDTYRILSAVDFCVMIIDASKGVEYRTKKLMKVISLQKTPVLTFINKIDRDGIKSIQLLSQIEKELEIFCAPMTLPLGRGKLYKGMYNFQKNNFFLHLNLKKNITTIDDGTNIFELNSINLENILSSMLMEEFRQEINLIKSNYYQFNKNNFLEGIMTPVFFGSALKNIGVKSMFDFLVQYAPFPKEKHSNVRIVKSSEDKLTGFIFKIQANMDLKHRDRIAFLRIVSGKYYSGIKLTQVRTKKIFTINKAIYCLASKRKIIQEAYPGDIIGIYNYGSIKIGDSFTEGEMINFICVSCFSPEIFRSIHLNNPLKRKQLYKGLFQLSEEGAIQIFYPISNSNVILGAIGILQFEVVSQRLKLEYKLDVSYKPTNIIAARWVFCHDKQILIKFENENRLNLAFDQSSNLLYLATSSFNLQTAIDKYPNINFKKNKDF